MLETHDGAAIGMTYRGMRHGPDEVMAKVNAGEYRSIPRCITSAPTVAFETAAPQYDWLNRIVAIGTGNRPPQGPVYDIFEVL